MPGPRIVKDENLAFLYLCLVNSDYTLINYPPIAAHLGIKPPAARMRFFRLKKAIEQSLSTLGGKADGGAKTGATGKQKRKRVEQHGDDDECCGEKARLAATIKAEGGKEWKGEGCCAGSAQAERGVKRRCSSAARVKVEERHPEPVVLARVDDDAFDGAVAEKRRVEQDTAAEQDTTAEQDTSVVFDDAERGLLRSEEDGFAIKDTFGFLEPLWPGPYACYGGFEDM